MIRHMHVDSSGDDFWGGLPKKRQCDMLDEGKQNLISKWWKIATTISPNRKDVKRRGLGMKSWEMHLTHYLRES